MEKNENDDNVDKTKETFADMEKIFWTSCNSHGNLDHVRDAPKTHANMAKVYVLATVENFWKNLPLETYAAMDEEDVRADFRERWNICINYLNVEKAGKNISLEYHEGMEGAIALFVGRMNALTLS